MAKSESYKQATCCQTKDCYLLDVNDEVCWGQVTVIAEDYTEDDEFYESWWIHSCEGHEDCIYSGKYKPEK